MLHRAIQFRRVAAYVGIALSLHGCGSTTVAYGTCYDLFIEPWPESAFDGLDSLYAAPPPRIRLDSVPANLPPGMDGGMQISTPDGVLPTILPWAGWSHTSDRQIELWWGDGYSGIALRLRGGPDVLRGIAETRWDYREGDITGARAELVDCASPVPDRARASPRLPKAEVVLSSGDTIGVGRSLPSGLGVLGVEGIMVSLDVQPVGLFRDVSELSVDTFQSRGVVNYVSLRYDEFSGVDTVRARLETFLGPAMAVDSARPGDPTSTPLITWMDRFQSVVIWGPEVSVTID